MVARWTFTGTNDGPLAGIPASGKPVNAPNGIGIFRQVDGKVTEGRSYLRIPATALQNASPSLPAARGASATRTILHVALTQTGASVSSITALQITWTTAP